MKNKKSPKEKGIGPMDAALRYLEFSARSVREVERHLDGCEYGEVEISETIDRLKELRLLDDERFADDFVASRLRAKPVSRAHLREQMYHHELGEEAISHALETVSDEMELANCLVLCREYAKKLTDCDAHVRYERIMRRLVSHGYAFSTARQAMDEMDISEEEVYE